MLNGPKHGSLDGQEHELQRNKGQHQRHEREIADPAQALEGLGPVQFRHEAEAVIGEIPAHRKHRNPPEIHHIGLEHLLFTCRRP